MREARGGNVPRVRATPISVVPRAAESDGTGGDSSMSLSSSPCTPVSASSRTVASPPPLWPGRYDSTRAARTADPQGDDGAPHGVPPTTPATLEPLEALVPDALLGGEPMLKMTQGKAAQRLVRVELDTARIVWASKRNNSVPLCALRDLRFGRAAQSYREALQVGAEHEPRWVSLVYQTPKAYKAVHFVAHTDASFERWRTTLQRVFAQRQALLAGRATATTTQLHWLRAAWRSRAPDAALDLPAVLQVCRRAGLLCSARELRGLFAAADAHRRGALDLDAFQTFAAALRRRPDVQRIFSALSCGADALSRDAFASFLCIDQGDYGWTDAQLDALYAQYASPVTNTLHVDGFATFLGAYATGGEQRAALPLERPLTDYYISSSHNTYLVGGQWKGDSTVEGYVRALQQGARSVELDCWDGPNGQPQVTHGHTLTSRVPFDDVVAAVAQYAFVSSPYPLILSLEVHNDVAQQDSIAAILRARLGGMLVTERVDGEGDVLPSPEQLRHRILVKTKDWNVIRAAQPPVLEDASSATSTEYTESEGDATLLGHARGLVRTIAKRPGRPATQRVMSDALSALLVYTVGVKCRGINKKESYAPEHMFSLSERKALRLIRTSNPDLVKHNISHLTRIYPGLSSLSRLSNSANYIPVDMWAAGCQLVALNWQTRDRGLELNQAMFDASRGYVLKPDGVRVRAAAKTVDRVVRVRLNLTIISAQQLPHVGRDDDVARPFVRFGVYAPSQWGSKAVKAWSERGECEVVPRGGAAPLPHAKDGEAAPDALYTHAFPAPHARSTMAPHPTVPPSSPPLPRTPTATGGLAPVWNTRCTLLIDLPAGPSSAEDIREYVWEGGGGGGGGAIGAAPVAGGPAVSRCTREESRGSPRGGAFLPTAPPTPSARSEAGAAPRHAPLPASTLARNARILRRATRGLLDLVFVRLQVYDDQPSSPVPLASSTAVLGRLPRGYRHLPLCDMQLSRLVYSSLFVHTEYTLEGVFSG
ncbi:phosphoinositide phospholipase C [Malassezia sp. CBS 17886]|nr:phosphoinositide phospholipase C [Malassezia sp. CBS 17886]